MLRLFAIILAATLTFSMPSFALENQCIDEQIEPFNEQLEEAKRRLNLTTEQEEALKPILIENIEQLREIYKSYAVNKRKDEPELSFSKKRSLVKELKALKKESNDKVSQFLSEEQMKEYEKIQDEARDRLRKKRRDKEKQRKTSNLFIEHK